MLAMSDLEQRWREPAFVAAAHAWIHDQLDDRLPGPVLRIEQTNTAWTGGYSQDQEVVIPVKNGEGRYVADSATLADLERTGRVIARYVGFNPTGSMNDIAGITNEAGNVVGLMPHPEHAIDELTGPSVDGLTFFTSVLLGRLDPAAAARTQESIA